jgi:predicted nucleic acid-binding protein
MNAGDRAFFDTNILLYMYTDADPRKRSVAQELYWEHSLEGRVVVSTQVVQEFFVNGVRKLGLPRREAREVALGLLELPLVVIGDAQIRAAMDKESSYRISFWDALIVAAAEGGGAEILYTEDLNNGQRYGSVLARNPFLSPITGEHSRPQRKRTGKAHHY